MESDVYAMQMSNLDAPWMGRAALFMTMHHGDFFFRGEKHAGKHAD